MRSKIVLTSLLTIISFTFIMTITTNRTYADSFVDGQGVARCSIKYRECCGPGKAREVTCSKLAQKSDGTYTGGAFNVAECNIPDISLCGDPKLSQNPNGECPIGNIYDKNADICAGTGKLGTQSYLGGHDLKKGASSSVADNNTITIPTEAQGAQNNPRDNPNGTSNNGSSTNPPDASTTQVTRTCAINPLRKPLGCPNYIQNSDGTSVCEDVQNNIIDFAVNIDSSPKCINIATTINRSSCVTHSVVGGVLCTSTDQSGNVLESCCKTGESLKKGQCIVDPILDKTCTIITFSGGSVYCKFRDRHYSYLGSISNMQQCGRGLFCTSKRSTNLSLCKSNTAIPYTAINCCPFGSTLNANQDGCIQKSAADNKSAIADDHTTNILGASTQSRQLTPGKYKITSDWFQSTELLVTTEGVSIKFFIDQNGDKIRQSTENLLDNYNFNVTIEKTADVTHYKLNKGWNLISFDLINPNINTASDIFNLFNAHNIFVTHVSTYTDGKWVTYSRRKNNICALVDFGNDFIIIPGKSYFINVDIQSSIVLTGARLVGSTPINLVDGWNLISIQSQTKYTGISFLTKCTSSGIDCNSISKFNSGIYDILVLQNELLFGNNFNLSRNRGYFVRVLSGGKQLNP